MVVLLGRAHDPDDQGAKTPGGLSEWTASVEVGIGAKVAINSAGHVALGPVAGTPHERIGLVRYLHKVVGVQCVVEPHFNHIDNPDVAGHFCMAWYTSSASITLATAILVELAKVRPDYNLGLCRVSANERWVSSPRRYSGAPRVALLQDTPCPAVLIEYAHASNKGDVEFIEHDASRMEVGRAIGVGIVNWLKEVEDVEADDSDRADDPGPGD